MNTLLKKVLNRGLKIRPFDFYAKYGTKQMSK